MRDGIFQEIEGNFEKLPNANSKTKKCDIFKKNSNGLDSKSIIRNRP